MKALVYEPNNKLYVMEKPVPQLDPGEVLVKVKWAGICGSDLVAWQGGFPRIKQPVTLGHEMTGEVVELYDKSITNVVPGDRVVVEPIVACGQCEACRKGYYNVCRKLKVIGLDQDGAFANYVKVPAIRVHRIPESLSFERAALCEPVAVAVHMLRRTDFKFGDSVGITGAGPIGVLVAMVAKRSGAVRVVITDVNDYRLNLVRSLGITALDAKQPDLKNRFLDVLGEEGADVTFELAAHPDTLALAIDITKVRGTVLLGGIFKKPPGLDLQSATLKEQHLIGTRLYTFIDFVRAIELITQNDFAVESMVSKRIGLDEASEGGFEAIKRGENVIKVLINPEG